ncbi:microtubule organization protein AKNA isoform X2 [Triplophysa rosa]|uniref:AT-hook-containing transcription factor n=1 Tax=Triplophysa rosa TaxID=992332 RepID=A0A9W7WFT7_TRIRA|nr:microtubule organization protein AKNA isoform X2 [Triplophysa rosa]KAI7796098.1 putative AT-hook-containing transcription factor [Triplophysa rosa]
MKREPMEWTRGDTTAGVLVWTPAPAYSSPSSPEGSDFRWEEEVDEDFQSQMDENGIIGLAESQGQLEVDHREEEIAEDMLWYVKTPEPEDGPPPSALEEISFHLSELLDSGPLSQPTENDCHTSYMQEEQVADDDQSVLLEDWTDDEHDARSPMIHRQELHTFPERDGTLDMTDEDTAEKDMCEDSQRHTDHSFPVTEKMAPHIDPIKGLDFSQNGIEDSKNIPDVEITEHSEQSDSEELKKCFPSASHLSSPNTLHTFPHLSFEEQINNCGIEAETVSEGALSNVGVESSHSTSSHQRFDPKSYQTIQSRELEIKYKITPQTSVRSPLMKIRLGKTNHAGMSEDKGERRLHSPYHNHQLPTPSPTKTNPDFQDRRAQRIAKARECSPPPAPHRSSDKNNQRTSKTSHTDPDDIRKGQLSHPLPDFSKVGPKVHFPKGGYKPPKSRAVAHGKTSQPVLPVVFKSPAEIVREVLLSSTDESPGSPSSSGTHKRLNSTVPEEFRCPQQASTLVQQLQEDYNRLLTKYAEAENTIDRLRLKAQVSLYSDPPKPSTAILSGVIQEGSKVMTLSFPQAQRAEFGAGSANPTGQRDNLAHINSRKAQTRPSSTNSVSSRSSVSSTADHLTETLTKQTCRFQLQVDSFEELLKNGKLKPCEELKGVSTLAEGQESLERAYLDTRAQFRMLQQCQGRPLTFDPDRELEGQIFTSGMRLEELKERIKQNQTTLEPPSTPAPHSDMLSLSMLETEPLPESPLSAAHPEACVGAEVSSVNGESDEEEMLPSHLYHLNDKHQCVEKDFSKLMDRYQSFKELPGLLDRSVTLMGCDSLDFKHSSPPRNESSTNRQQWSSTDRAKRQPVADCGPPSGPSVRSQVCDAMETHPKAPCHSSLLPGQPGRERKTAGNRMVLSSSMTSLAESIETGNRILKTKSKTVVAPPLDGVVSPETDSGFMGSESSQLTPAVHSPLQQRAVVRSSGPHMKNPIKANSACRTRQPLAVSSSPSRLSLDPPADHLSTGRCTSSVGRRAREERCSASSLATSTSTLHWPETTLQPGPCSLTSQSEHGSDQEEKARDNPCPQPANLQSGFHRSPSLRVPYHHSDLKAQSSVQLTNHQEALQSLQQEVNKVKERLEGSLRLSKPSSPVIAPPNISEDTRDNTPPQAATPQWLDLRSSERMGGQREMGSREIKGRSGAPRLTLRKRSASLPRYRSESNTRSDSEHVQSEPRASAMSYIPVSPMTSRGRRQTRSGFGHHQNCTTHQTPEAESEDSGDTEPSPVPQPTCARCASKRIGAPARPARSTRIPRPAQSHCSHCPLCGALQSSQSRIPQPENQGSVPGWSQPMRSLQRERVGFESMAVAPSPTVLGSVPVVPYMPVYPSTLYISSPVTAQAYSQPFNISMSPSRDERSEVRGHRRHSLSMDHQQSSLSSSLKRAITVARNMRRVSRHMAHSMASGLENMSVLATTY